jgi:PHD/YefM family antitoxin component YafN of YafNO toxin-antitoxin module
MQETLYLLSVPAMKERLDEGVKLTVDDCEDFEW